MKTRGFSLIELLVAMAIFSVMALGLHQVWRNVSQTKSTTDLHREQLISLNKTLTYLERDLWQIVGRRVRDSYGDPVAPLMVGGTDYVLALTRTGWRHPGFRVRSHLQSVAWGLNSEGQLYRDFWLQLDRAPDSEPVRQILLEQVVDIRIEAVDEDKNHHHSWPTTALPSPAQPSSAQQGHAVLPQAIIVTLETKNFGEIQRVIPLV